MEQSINIVFWGWLLLASGCVAVALFTYRFIWLERYRFPVALEGDAVRVQGRVMGRPGRVVYCLDENGVELVARAFRVWSDEGRAVNIVPGGAVLDVRPFRHPRGMLRGVMVGDRVTVDGIPGSVACPEHLYRQAGRDSAVEAVRIVGGSWPELAWLRLPLVLACVAFLLSLGKVLHAPVPAPVEPSAEQGSVDIRVVRHHASFYLGGGGVVDENGLGGLIGDQLGQALGCTRDHGRWSIRRSGEPFCIEAPDSLRPASRAPSRPPPTGIFPATEW